MKEPTDALWIGTIFMNCRSCFGVGGGYDFGASFIAG